MGTVLNVLGVLFIIHTRDHQPPHVTIYRGTPQKFEAMARIEIESSRIMSSSGFRNSKLKMLARVVKAEREYLMEKWNESRPK